MSRRYEQKYVPLNWRSLEKYRKRVYYLRAPGDGSCLLHSVCYAMFEDYRNEKHNGKPMRRSKMIAILRKNLADKLEKIDERTGKTYYESIGNLSDIGKQYPEEYSLRALQKMFRSSSYLGHETITILEYLLGITIYVLSKKRRDIEVINGDPIRRNSVVVYYSGEDDNGHYDTISFNSVSRGMHVTYFGPNDPFIMFLLDKIKSKKRV